MAATRTPTEWVEELYADQRRRWRQGERVLVESYLSAHPSLRDDAECVLQLVNNEVVLREELHDTPRLDEYLRRFPRFAVQLQELFEVHQALESIGLFTPGGDPTPLPARHSDGLEAAAAPGRPTPVPGYEVLGVLGRGGMGWCTRRGRSASTASSPSR